MMDPRRRGSSRIFLVSEVHPANWWLWWSLSFVRPIRVRVLHPQCTRWPLGHMGIIDSEAYFTVDTANAFKSRALGAWKRWLPRVQSDAWHTGYRGTQLDFSTKVKQELSRQFERLLFLKELQERAGQEAEPLIVTSAYFQFLARLDPESGLLAYRTTGWLSRINIVCDGLWLRMATLSYALRTLGRLVRGLVSRCSSPLLGRRQFLYVYDCDNTNELYIDPGKRTFTWLSDERLIRKEQVLFLLPPSTSRAVLDGARAAGYAACRLSEAYQCVPRQELFSASLEILKSAGRCLSPFAGIARIMISGYLLRVSAHAPVACRWQPRVYIESVSNIGIENPALVYLKSLGISTVMYHMSGSYIFGQDVRQPCDFRAAIYAHTMASVVAVWHADYQRFLASHPQDGAQIRVVGPLMPGDEAVMREHPSDLRSKWLSKWSDQLDGYRYIAAFDVGSASRQLALSRWSYQEFFSYPDPYNEAYNLRFLQDMWRLLQEHDTVRLLFKPKRNPWNKKFLYSQACLEIIGRMQAHPRSVVLEENINPWLPLAMADACIVLPLTSPGLAALHYGIPCTYHDPANVVRVHRCQSLSGLITHSYRELTSRVRVLFPDAVSAEPLRRCTPAAEVRDFIGECPHTDSSDRFRTLLHSLVPLKRAAETVQPDLSVASVMQ